MSTPKIEIYYANEIPFNIRFDSRWIHSKNPEIEAKRQFQEFYQNIINEQIQMILFIKIGLGYILDFFLDLDYSLYWFEPNITIRNLALERIKNKYQSFGLYYQKLNIIEEFSPKLLQEWGEKLLLTEIFYLKTYLSKEDLVTIDLFYRKKFYYSVNYQTVKKFEKLWISNLYKNFLYAQNFYAIDSLKGILKNFPVLIVSGGPSLDQWIPILKKYHERFFVISVDTALNALVSNHIHVDFLISIDAQFVNYLHLEGLLNHINYLLIDPLTCPLTVRYSIHNANIFVFNNSLPFVKFLLLQLFSEISFLKSGGSVTTSALDLANYMEAKEIFLVGADFSFVNHLIHTKYSKIENRFLYKMERIFSLEFFNYKQMTAIPRKYCFDINKNKIPTNDKLLIFKEWYEKNTQLNKDKIFLLYGNGYDLKQTKKMFSKKELEGILKDYPVLNKKNYLEKIIKNFNKKNSIQEILSTIYKNLSVLKQKIEIVIFLLKDKKLESRDILELENEILSFEELKLLQFTEIHKISFLSFSQKEAFEKQLEEVYEAIRLNLEFHLECIRKSLAMLHSSE